MKWGCQVADGAYLSLAQDLRAPIATADGGMRTAARSNRIGLHWAEAPAGRL